MVRTLRAWSFNNLLYIAAVRARYLVFFEAEILFFRSNSLIMGGTYTVHD